MRKALLAVAAFAGAMLLPSTVASGQTATADSVVGSQVANAFSFGIDARSGPSGENPSGTAGWQVGVRLAPSWTVDITCLSVTGNTAVAGFSGRSFRFFAGSFPVAGLIRVVDAGGPASGLDTFEWAEQLASPLEPAPPGPTDCSSYPSSFPPTFSPQRITTGDIVVTDAQPFPTSKDQCKNGGWESFGVFKNLGDCVSFVATGGKNPPSEPRPSERSAR